MLELLEQFSRNLAAKPVSRGVLEIMTRVGSVTLSLALLAISAGLILRKNKRERRSKLPLPPSPGVALPLIGHLHMLRGTDPMDFITSMRSKCGKISSFFAGNRLVVVLNGYDVIREALVDNAKIFSHRPRTFMADQLAHGCGIVNLSGKHWEEHRRFSVRTLRLLGTNHPSSAVHRIQPEVDALLEKLDVFSKNGIPLDLAPLLTTSCSNVLLLLIYGHRFDLDDPLLVEIVSTLKSCLANLSSTGVLNFLPCVRYIPGDPCRYWATIQDMNTLEKILVHPQVTEHERSMEISEASDVVFAYLHEMVRKKTLGMHTFLDKENLVKFVGDLLAGGSHTVSTTILWILLYLVRFPEVQERCYQEIFECIGQDGIITQDDFASLPFVSATIFEVQRHADVSALSVAHGLASDTEFRGYHLPKEAIVIVNIHSVHHDPEVWGDPEVFRPERFLDENGKVIHSEHFIPYSMGPRRCLGENFGRTEVFMYTISLLQRFRFRYHGSMPSSLKGVMALVHSPLPFDLCLERRK